VRVETVRGAMAVDGLDGVLPALREHGVDEAQITAMLVHHPAARYFTGGQE
jgi:predicted metal-dependent phosphotriesterase family hydrolase